MVFRCLHIEFNPFAPDALFLYPLKTSENRKVFLCFHGVEKKYIGNKYIKHAFTCQDIPVDARLKLNVRKV